MKVEVLIYAYLAICFAMIIFNIVCIFIFRRKDKKLHKRSEDFTTTIEEQLQKDEIAEEHFAYLEKKLKHIQHMMAFDETLEKIYETRPKDVKKYITKLNRVFVALTVHYGKKNRVQAAYYPYIIKKYEVFSGENNELVIQQLLELMKVSDLYCRENALQALYSVGDIDAVIAGLKILNKGNYFHHTKMITDGLLSFFGDKEKLDDELWKLLDELDLPLQRALLDYFRFSSEKHSEKMLQIMKDETIHQELRFSAIRYFAKYKYEPALETLYNLVAEDRPEWEYRAIAASSLGNYPSTKTEELLKKLLSNSNWHVRYNASDSLERLGVAYYDMIDVFEGKDRYASEMLRYRFDRKKLAKKEDASV